MSAYVSRRGFLRGMAGTIAYAASGIGYGFGQEKRTASAAWECAGGLITRQKNPDNLEFPFATLDSFITPNEKFYVRNHFEQPKVEVGAWRLKVEGAVHRELQLSLDDVRKLPAPLGKAKFENPGNCQAFPVSQARGAP